MSRTVPLVSFPVRWSCFKTISTSPPTLMFPRSLPSTGYAPPPSKSSGHLNPGIRLYGFPAVSLDFGSFTAAFTHPFGPDLLPSQEANSYRALMPGVKQTAVRELG